YNGGFFFVCIFSDKMGGVCLCYSWTCRSVWPVFIMLVTLPCLMDCSQSPAAAAGKVYPGRNHWAVGHLMGKKSIEVQPELKTDPDSDHLQSPGTAEVTLLGQDVRLMATLAQQNNLKQMKPQTADGLRLWSSWREEDGDKYPREVRLWTLPPYLCSC
uniref:Uncharacterized protein n=1 Tax=Echeneis naucrates TaxID=173247 RepID=A0A665WV56_ECHNA